MSKVYLMAKTLSARFGGGDFLRFRPRNGVPAAARALSLENCRRPRTAPSVKCLIAFALVAPLAACAVAPKQYVSTGYSLTSAKRMFAVGYDHITDKYLLAVDGNRLTMHGIEGLAKIDPAITWIRTDDRIALHRDGDLVSDFALPQSGDPEDWAYLTANIMHAGRAASPLLGEASAERLYDAVYTGITRDLDLYSRYATADAARTARESREGFGGIGVRVRLHAEDGQLEIVSVMEDSPAASNDVKPGDVLLEIDGESLKDVPQHEAVKRLRGRVNSPIKLTVFRPQTGSSRSFTIARTHIVPNTATYERDGNIAIIKVTHFNQKTAENLTAEIEKALLDDDRPVGLILDLRGNPGGLLDKAVEVADVFLRDGRIVSTVGRHQDSYQMFDATEGDLTSDMPLAVLINGNTASAAEIVAAALQDGRRAVVIGSNSYGKGTVQTVVHMPNHGELIVTWSRIRAPSGYLLHNLGILPTLCTSGHGDDAETVVRALRDDHERTHDLMMAWRAATEPEDDSVGELREACPASLDSDEIDRDVARILLEDHALYAQALALSFTEVAER